MMPVYVYGCDRCDYNVEKLESRITDPPAPSSCEKCVEGKVERQIGHALLNFKGSGWSSDGYSGKKR